MELLTFIKTLPKAELHLHFEGAIPWHLVQEYNSDPVENIPHWWANNFLFDDFTHFSEAIRFCFYNVLTNTTIYHLVAKQIFKNLVAQNVRYVEISISPEHVQRQQLSLVEVISAIKQAAPPQLIVRVFCGLSRNISYTRYDKLVKTVLNTPNLDGLDLHGDESIGKPAPFADIFNDARKNGLATKAHAGEIVGPQSIIEALNYLNVNRIEHGTTAINNKALMTRLVEENITLDMCPSSNLKLQVVDSIKNHPIKQFYNYGIKVTVNTDDPTVFGCNLTTEIELLANYLDFSPYDLAQLQINAFEVALISTETKKELLTEVNMLLANYQFSPLAV